MAILGDGCLQLSSPELATVVQYNLPIIICLLNNRQHGMVAQFQDEYLESRYHGTRTDYSQPDFSCLARSYGFSNYFKVESPEALERKLNEAKAKIGEPIFIEIVISESAKALPKQSFKK